MKKTYITFCIILCLLMSLISCKAKPSNGSGGDQPNDGNVSESNGDYIYSSSSAISVVYEKGQATEESLIRLQEVLYEKLDVTRVEFNNPTKVSEHEIILGKADRALSETAYQALARIEKEDGEVGFVVYSDGKSIAVAYDEDKYGINAAETEAINYLINELLTASSLKALPGALCREKFDVIEWQEAVDDAELEKQWDSYLEKLKRNLSDEEANQVIEALKDMNEMASDNVTTWIANLYDPVTGGFYYSNSARDTEGYLPDLESTYQLLGLPKSLGMTDLDVGEFYPEEIQNQIVRWVKNLQDPDNGYFYHPQWGKSFTDQLLSRRGRDLQWAERLLAYFGASPTYDTPNGVKGDGVLADGTPVVPTAIKPLTEKLGTSAVAAVSKVIAVNDPDANVATHLKNEENFRAYLATLDINGSSYGVGNTMESQATQLVARDKVLEARGEKYRLCDILEEWFNDHQNPETGLWTLDGSKDGAAINGLLKIGATYNKIGKKIPNLDKALMAAIDYITSGEDPVHICYVLNPLYAISELKTNANRHSGAAAAVIIEQASAIILERAVPIIEAVTKNLALFKKLDGSYSYYPTQTASSSQGAPVAVNGSNEGDANSTNIGAAAIPGHLYAALGLGNKIDICTKADGLRFLEILEDLGPIIKDTPDDERDTASGEFVRKYGGQYYPDSTSTNAISTLYRANTYLGADGRIESPRCEYIKIVTDEDRDTGVLEYGKSTDVHNPAGFVIRRTGAQGAGNCFVFETEVRVMDVSDAAVENLLNLGVPALFDIQIGKYVNATSAKAVTCDYYGSIGSILLKSDGEKCSTALSHATRDFQYELYETNGYNGSYTDVGKWCVIRIELYDNGIAKYYLNNKCFEEAQIFDSTSSFFTEIDAVRVSLSGKAVSSTAWFDNTFVGTVEKTYKQGAGYIDYSDYTLKAGNYSLLLGGYNYDVISAQTLQSLGYLTRATWNTTTVTDSTDKSTLHREYIEIVEYTDAKGKPNSALKFGELITNSAGIYLRRVTPGSGDCFIFESDIYLDIDETTAKKMTKKGAVPIMSFYLGESVATTSVLGTEQFYKGSSLAYVYAKQDNNGTLHYYINRPMSENYKACVSAAEITSGWHRFTMEMYDNGRVKYFLDGEFIGDSKVLSTSDAKSFDTLNSVRVEFADDIDYSYSMFDNTLITMIDKEYEKDDTGENGGSTPVIPTPEDGSIYDKEDDVSDEGWSE